MVTLHKLEPNGTRCRHCGGTMLAAPDVDGGTEYRCLACNRLAEPPDEPMPPAEAAKALGWDAKRIYNIVARGYAPNHGEGSRILVKLSELRAWADGQNRPKAVRRKAELDRPNHARPALIEPATVDPLDEAVAVYRAKAAHIKMLSEAHAKALANLADLETALEAARTEVVEARTALDTLLNQMREV